MPRPIAVGQQDGIPWLSMKLIDGASLASQLQTFVRDPIAAARLTATLARAVHYAHQRGVLHRDLKPANVLLDADGDPHVTDFGLAKRLERNAELTHTGDVLGTPSYMAPEQARGNAEQITAAADVYGLGAILYALLTGRPPFQAKTQWETCRQVVETEPVRPSARNRRVDRDLEMICLKCMEKDPERRYGSADAVAGDLRRWLRHEPILAHSISASQRFWRWYKRRPAFATMAAVIAALLLVIVVGSPLAAVWWREQRDRAVLAEKMANTREREAKRALFDSCIVQARASQGSRHQGRRFDGLSAVAKAARLIPELGLGDMQVLTLRNHAIACMALPDIQRRRSWSVPSPNPPYGPEAFFDVTFDRYSCSDAAGPGV